jgi:DNA-binding transcriptional ArsR family regulator
MISDFEKIKLFGAVISKEYSKDLLRLLYLYKDISASEAASRMGMHIKTVQEFFDALYEVGLLDKREVYESKRPYFRYSFSLDRIDLSLDVKELVDLNKSAETPELFIREKKNANVRFTTARSKLFFSSVSVWIGQGRETTEKKVSLTIPQGRFLFNLPFPNAEFLSIFEIMKKADVSDEHKSEIVDIVHLLNEHGVIETKE